MQVWTSSHGSGAILSRNDSFSITADEAGSVIRPKNANHLKGTVIFPIPSVQQSFSHFSSVAVDCSSDAARVLRVAIMSGSDEVFHKDGLRKTEDFTVRIAGANVKAEDDSRGLALLVTVEFLKASEVLEFQSVGLEVFVPSTKPVEMVQFDTGTWNVENVRSWAQPSEKAEDRVNFSKEFSSIPNVMVSMTGADVSGGTNFRVKVYATNVDSRGFTVHADSWNNTQLYSCGVSWIAIGV